MIAVGFRLWLAFLLLLSAVPLAAAQDGSRGSVPLPGGSAPDPEVLKRLAAQLGGGNSKIQFDPELIQAAQRLFGNGKIDPELLKQAKDQLDKMPKSDRDQLIQQVQGQLKPPDSAKPPDVPRPPIDPNRLPQGPPMGPQPRVQPDNPFAPPPRSSPPPGTRPPGFSGLPNTSSAKEAIAFWERNIGSLDEMPAVRDALIALATSGLATDGTGKPFWEDMVKDLTADGGGSSSGLFKWLEDNTSGWSLSAGGGGGSGWSPPGSSWGGSSGGGVGPPSAEGLGAVGIVFLALVGAALVGVFFWKVLPVIREGRTPRPLPGQGPWPVDPRAIRSREQLVRAFEYLSVLECGDRAKSWNHVTIADGLRAAVPNSAAYADALARLYALARYTPEAEPLADGAIGEARAYLCQLAGVSPA